MTDADDALSDVLRLVRLRACVYFTKDMPRGWGVGVAKSAHGPLHMVLNGACVLRHDGRDISLKAGDAVVLPKGAEHAMLASPDSAPDPRPDAMERLLALPAPDTPATRMLCGHFEWDGALDHPLFGELPDLIVVRDVFAQEGGTLFRTVVDLITAEQDSDAPGASALTDRMGEVLFVSLLRAWLTAHDPARGVLATINDARLSRALNHIHRHHAVPLDLNTLARVAGMSRTAFATRFHEVMGTPPKTYLTEWRMLEARKLLTRTDRTLSEIGERVGYGSDAAFVRAFKRRFGQTPARLRRAAASRAAA